LRKEKNFFSSLTRKIITTTTRSWNSFEIKECQKEGFIEDTHEKNIDISEKDFFLNQLQ